MVGQISKIVLRPLFIIAFTGVLGRYAQAYSWLIALSVSFLLAPILAKLTKAKYYILRPNVIYLPLLHHPESALILDTAHAVANIIHNTHNINTAVARVAKIIFALKSYAHQDNTGEIIEVDLADGLETVLTMYQSQIKQGTVLVRQIEKVAPVCCLPDELNQVWTNLIHNALQAMNNQGTLTIGLRQVGEQAVVTVGDTGCGITVR